MIKINIDLDRKLVDDSIRVILSAIDGPTKESINRKAGNDVKQAASEYHRVFDAEGGWKGARYLGANARSGAFGARVALGWSLSDADKDGITITNNAEHYAFKVSGGTITPKRAKNLTIPIVAEARGLYVRDYVRITGRKLFRPRGKNVLMEKTDSGGIRAVYALAESITHRPWPNALPPENQLTDAFVLRYTKELIRLIES